MLKGTVSYWLNSTKPLRSSKTGTSFFNGIKHSEPCQFQKLLEAIMNGLFPVLISFPIGWNVSVSRYNSTFYRLSHFVFSMKNLWLKIFFLIKNFLQCHIFRIFPQYKILICFSKIWNF